jgi:hypothetical protein
VLGGVLLLLWWPISTPTPIAIKSVATPATSVAAYDARGRYGRGRTWGSLDAGAAWVPNISPANRARPRRSPQLMQ